MTFLPERESYPSITIFDKGMLAQALPLGQPINCS